MADTRISTVDPLAARGTEVAVNDAKVSTKNSINSPGLYVNTGITAFFGNDVVFALTTPGNAGGAGFVGFSPVSVPEIDPTGVGSVLAMIGGGLGLLERRRQGDPEGRTSFARRHHGRPG